MAEESQEQKTVREANEKAASDKAAADKEAEEKTAADKVVKDELAAEEAKKTDSKTPKGGSPIEDAKETLGKLEEQNKIMSENLKKATELQAEMMISGKTPAGQGSLSEEEQKDADARKLIEGSGFEDRLFPKKK